MVSLRICGRWLAALLLSTAGLVADGPSAMSVADAAKQRDEQALRALVEQGADVNAPQADGSTALHWAAYANNQAMAELLIQSGANASAANRYGVTPLMLAATNGNAAMIDLLLKAGVDPNAALPEGETALMNAARSGNVDAVNLLVAGGADVNADEDWRGQTALMWAAAEGHLEVVKALIDAGAEINARSSDGGFTPFLFAVREGRLDVVRALIEAGVDVNEALPANERRRRRRSTAPEATGASALVLAVANAHYEIAATLLEAGADPNAAGQGWTALHTITWIRKPGQGSNDPAPPGSGNMDSLTLVRKLVAHGADVNARMTRRSSVGKSSLNTLRATPFLLAARTGDAELMRLLVELGADPLLPNDDGTTPLMVAAGVGTRAPGEDAGFENEALEAVKIALKLGNDINAVDARGETAMHGAAYKHLPSVVQFLADNGADINVWNKNNALGWTPLRIAVGVHRGMNFRSSPETAAVLEKIMIAAGVSTEVEPEPVISGATR